MNQDFHVSSKSYSTTICMHGIIGTFFTGTFYLLDLSVSDVRRRSVGKPWQSSVSTISKICHLFFGMSIYNTNSIVLSNTNFLVPNGITQTLLTWLAEKQRNVLKMQETTVKMMENMILNAVEEKLLIGKNRQHQQQEPFF